MQHRLEDVLQRWAEASTNLQEHNSAVLQRVSDLYLAARTAPAPAKEVKVPKFDGSRAWAVFIAQFQSAATSNEWDDEEKGRRLLNALKGSAADLVQTLPVGEYLNYESLRTRLQQHFDPAQRILVAEAELDRRVQKPSETLQAFGADVLSMTRVAYPTWPEDAVQTMARKTFIAGLADSEVRREVRLRQPTSFNDALVAALHIDSVERLEQPSKKAKVCQVICSPEESTPAAPSAGEEAAAATTRRVGASGQSRATIDQGEKLTGLLEELRQLATSLSPTSRAACYECHQVGHFVRDCPLKQRAGAGYFRRNNDYRRPYPRRDERDCPRRNNHRGEERERERRGGDDRRGEDRRGRNSNNNSSSGAISSRGAGNE